MSIGDRVGLGAVVGMDTGASIRLGGRLEASFALGTGAVLGGVTTALLGESVRSDEDVDDPPSMSIR